MDNKHDHETDNKVYDCPQCTLCGRKFPEVIINVEGWVHHNTPYTCLDKKKCKRYMRKMKRKT